MFRIIFTGMAMALAVPATAATIDMPEQTGTFGNNARGYWFTAPVDFVMRGVLVPTTASSGPQSVAVMRLSNPPPLFSNVTNAFSVLHLTQGDAGAAEIPLALQFLAGDVVGILGVRDNVNSYAPSGYVANLGGNAITLQRLGMQFALSNTAPRDLWTENGGSISRVFFSYELGTLSPAVPEPSTWAMLILGFGAVGGTMRRRSATAKASRMRLTYA
jgi:PEP-CTERM motif